MSDIFALLGYINQAFPQQIKLQLEHKAIHLTHLH